MTSWLDYNSQNQSVVDRLIQKGFISSKEVENAFRCVNRAAFLPTEKLGDGFNGEGPIVCSPHIHMMLANQYATILENLQLEPGMSYLTIGSGTGYMPCLVGHIIKKYAINNGIEFHNDLVDFSYQHIDDFLKKTDADICRPCIISGNCFRLDQTQMKYDRLYCSKACDSAAVIFFLGFLKVGGFMITVHNSKLIKLERVSHKQGVKTVLRSSWVSSLRLHQEVEDNLKRKPEPLLRFPMKAGKQKKKKILIASNNFPVSNNKARKKLLKLRALQDVLDSLERDGSVPLPFCYVPQLDQMNAYKQCSRAVECSPSHNIPESKSVSPLPADERLSIANSDERFPLANRLQSPASYLYTIDEAGESETVFSSSLSLREPTIVRKLEFSSPECVNLDTEITGNVCKDMWEHLCTDNLWKLVVDYYYSVCATTEERRRQCLSLKGAEIVNPAATRLADLLSFKLNKKKKKSSTNECNHRLDKSDTNTNPPGNSANSTSSSHEDNELCEFNDEASVASPSHDNSLCTLTPSNSEEKTLDQICDNSALNAVSEASICLEDVVDDELTATPIDSQDRQECLEESLDSIVLFHSLSSVGDGEQNLDNDCDGIVKSKKKKKRKQKFVDIRTNNEVAENLRRVQCATLWSGDHDVELVLYIVSKMKESEGFALKELLPKTINPEFFDKNSLIRYPLISAVAPEILSYRSIALIRVTTMLDCVLDLLVGPSPSRNQYKSPFKEHYPLDSFTDSSFLPSDSQLNVLEAQCFRRSSTAHCEDKSSYQEASSTEEEELLKEVGEILTNETAIVGQQTTMLIRKLELIDGITEQYKEQTKVLTRQIDLIDEQQQFFVENNISEETADVHNLQVVSDWKQQRFNLIMKREGINNEKMKQLKERKELLSMLEQVISLETRLTHEKSALDSKGMGYLLGEGGSSLSCFSQFVSKADKIKKRLRAASTRMTNIMDNKHDTVASERGESNANILFRYQPHSILPRCRFLLPLSQKRTFYIREMLRASQRSPKSMPVINIDRSVPLIERHKHSTNSTVFIQIHNAVRTKDLHYRWSKNSNKQWWEIRFLGEGIIDQGGGFRDSLVEISEELCPPDPDVKGCLNLFVKSPNQVSGLGDFLDCYTVNPSCTDYHLYHWLGKLMGACFRTDESLLLPLPPFIWKLIVGEYVFWKKDFSCIDEAAVKNIDGLANLDEDAYVALNIEQTYSTVLSDGSHFDLVPSGSTKVVKVCERANYSTMVRKTRMMECAKQVQSIREGLISVIPEGVLSCLTWKDFENCVCGSPSISVADLKANCRYGDDLKLTSQRVTHMWAALASFTEEDRSRFLRFITGRKRLPSPFIVCRSSSEKGSLPSTSTCCGTLYLPEYSNLQAAKEKLRYAIYNCIAIDTDTNPW